MAKYCGKIGYRITEETKPGVWSEEITEHLYFGDVNRASRRLDQNNAVNDGINANVQISIVADPFAYENFQYILYAEWMGAKWKVSSAEVQYPRLILTIGGLYNV